VYAFLRFLLAHGAGLLAAWLKEAGGYIKQLAAPSGSIDISVQLMNTLDEMVLEWLHFVNSAEIPYFQVVLSVWSAMLLVLLST